MPETGLIPYDSLAKQPFFNVTLVSRRTGPPARPIEDVERKVLILQKYSISISKMSKVEIKNILNRTLVGSRLVDLEPK